MKVILLANWGLGLEVLKVLHNLSDTHIYAVVTRHLHPGSDKWDNVVYDFALKHGYRTIKEEKISFDKLKDDILKADIDLLISHAFMKILPESVFSAPNYGSINIHPSLLPKYRGPSPSYWVLKNRDKETGLTCHYIDRGIDTGDIIFQVTVPVEPQSSVDSIIECQKGVVQELVIQSLRRISDKQFHPIVQDSELASFAPKPRKNGA